MPQGAPALRLPFDRGHPPARQREGDGEPCSDSHPAEPESEVRDRQPDRNSDQTRQHAANGDASEPREHDRVRRRGVRLWAAQPSGACETGGRSTLTVCPVAPRDPTRPLERQ